MSKLDPQKQREFAVEAVRQLRDHGFQAYWAGGCVRDHLLGRTPKDYDVATSAHPEEIQGVFRHRKTLAMGAAFGVMTVLGPRAAGQIEVATFRQDVSYSDGRHPDRVEFSSPEEDARRRDFTINGMFYDPLDQRIIDFVGGESDLRQGVIRAIGDARARFTEDKLRMLRAVRFASVFNFRLEGSTLAAMCEMARQVTVVSVERIADEMRMMLVHPARERAVYLLYAIGLLGTILPEAAAVAESEKWPLALATETEPSTVAVQNSSPTLALLGAVEQPSFPLALAILLHAALGNDLAETVGRRWKLARAETERLAWLLLHQKLLAQARTMRWSQLQPLLIDEGTDDLLKLHAAQAALGWIDPQDVAYCQIQLDRPAAELDPPPLVTGNDLLAVGIPAGRIFARLLRSAREAQLDGVVADHAAALELIQRLWHAESG
jgi:tRNA nucleotidyltransferase/poly(A) polymerase